MEQAQKAAKRRADNRQKRHRTAEALSRTVSFLLAAAAILFTFLVWLSPMTVSGDSMSPALQDGEIVFADRLGKYWKRPGRGDMIVFTTGDGAFIKRIVGLPGETVELVDGQVFIDSRPLDERMYINDPTGDMAPVIVPEGAVFVLGDNRAKVYDSRMSEVGCIQYEHIYGVMRLRVSPIRRLTVFY